MSYNVLFSVYSLKYGCIWFYCRSVKRVGDRKIYLMTDAGSEYSDDQLDQICTGLKGQSVELIVV